MRDEQTRDRLAAARERAAEHLGMAIKSDWSTHDGAVKFCLTVVDAILEAVRETIDDNEFAIDDLKAVRITQLTSERDAAREELREMASSHERVQQDFEMLRGISSAWQNRARENRNEADAMRAVVEAARGSDWNSLDLNNALNALDCLKISTPPEGSGPAGPLVASDAQPSGAGGFSDIRHEDGSRCDAATMNDCPHRHQMTIAKLEPSGAIADEPDIRTAYDRLRSRLREAERDSDFYSKSANKRTEERDAALARVAELEKLCARTLALARVWGGQRQGPIGEFALLEDIKRALTPAPEKASEP